MRDGSNDVPPAAMVVGMVLLFIVIPLISALSDRRNDNEFKARLTPSPQSEEYTFTEAERSRLRDEYDDLRNSRWEDEQERYEANSADWADAFGRLAGTEEADYREYLEQKHLDSPEAPRLNEGCRGGCESYPTWCQTVIKGNVAYQTGERIYHMPWDEYYDETRIDTRYGELWFCTAEEAEDAGWRRALR